MLNMTTGYEFITKITDFQQACFKYGVILYNEAITNPNRRLLLPFDWLIHSGLILARCHKILFFSVFRGWEINLKTKIFKKEIQTDCEGDK